MKLRVACVQYNPIIGELEKNKLKIKSLLAKISSPIDLIVLPELSITGYNFKDKQHIEPYLDRSIPTEGSKLGSSRSFGQELLKLYKCFTVIGYPQLVQEKIYNSCSLIDPLGQEIYDYHKTFLYDADEAWGCSENPDKSFAPVDVEINHEKVRINFGICMDLNPYKFEAPFNKFEFALSCYENQSKLIICPMAWLSPFSPSIKSEMLSLEKLQLATELEQKHFTNQQSYQINALESDNIPLESCKSIEEFTPLKPDYSTINYHILRLFPFLNHKYNMLPKYGKVNVITCNRIGIESDVVYGGSSSMFTFDPAEPGNDEINYLNPSVNLKGYLSQGLEGVLYRELDI